MKRAVLITLAILMWESSSGIGSYGELIFRVSQSCENSSLLLTVAFTNDVMTYKASSTNIQARCAADLALAISLMHRMDYCEECVASDECLCLHQSLVSNIVYCSDLEDGSWIRYAAAAEYALGLNYGNQQIAAFNLSTNMIERIKVCPPNMGMTNYWDSMTCWMKSPHESLLTVFSMNAAIWLAGQNRNVEIEPLTNSMPDSAINIVFEELNCGNE